MAHTWAALSSQEVSSLGLPQLFDNVLDFLCPVFRADENGIFCLDHDDVANANRRDQLAVSMNERLMGVNRQMVTLDNIPEFVRKQQIVQRRPRADVAPSNIDGRTRSIVVVLH